MTFIKETKNTRLIESYIHCQLRYKQEVQEILFSIAGFFIICFLSHLMLFCIISKRLKLYLVFLQVLILIVLFSVSISLYKWTHKMESFFEQQCNDPNEGNDILKIDELYNMANKYICTDACPCRVGNISQGKQNLNLQLDRFKWSYEDQQTIISHINGVTKFEQCLMRTQMKNKEEISRNLELLQILEQEYHCAAMCRVSPFFAFSDVRKQYFGLQIQTEDHRDKIAKDRLAIISRVNLLI
ncbi:UNKNOWN [Stylonychia lemnae]|uniref:Transmembrane protein n=1 Tax=Stylonychia lemnae TaxID=5949 RepID=A0A078A8W7_STYLE|nr:UNKNOWN [Stylonychia lemnae]|eukprot:CDW78321.1 UNKNOWN [Stylonychia lemnae]